MLRKSLYILRGAISTLLYFAALVIFATLTILAAGLSFIIPIKTLKHHAMKIALLVPILWMDVNKLIMLLSGFHKFDIQGKHDELLSTDQWYVMISNHCSWLDILVLGVVFKHKVPILKFFMKKELLWQLPVAGLACYALGFPLLERHTRADIRKNPKLKGKDIETTKKACSKFKEHPTTVINFLEGTRFTAAKKEKSTSPYRNLLKPKAGGTALAIEQLANKLTGIINVTLHYPEEDFSLWKFACGDFKRINVHYEVLPITEDLIGDYYEDRVFRKHIQAWLNDVWERKDSLITSLGANE